MGRQTGFYMVPEDEDEFIEFVRSTGDVLILPQVSFAAEGEVLSSLRELEGHGMRIESCHLWNRSISPEPKIEYIPNQGYYSLDFMQSEVVNVRRSVRREQMLFSGRLHIEVQFQLPDGGYSDKSIEFIKWYEKLCRWIRKSFKRKRPGGSWMSPRAEALMQKGVQLI